ncbi:hypothetical protein LQ318_14660 [Aliifodinibius salicampi]|uniref:Lipoprotein n=1 Tax=Fodinibius salicampi TaxID=1920655 RepID=A0ABT3Q1Z8_9BACT|nr:hypothetical protein [Fodinibius salicampi]MCW9714152.1 hypothetical protein [Fodinibius salicampi]
MKYIQSRFTYILTGVIGIITIAVACSDTIKSDSEQIAGVEELTQSTEFKSLVGSIEQLNAPLVKKMIPMEKEEIREFKKNISSYIDNSGSKPKLTIDSEQMVQKDGL